ncbi:pheA operon leader peptide PheL [Serratia sp. UGAL515B_01]|nr:pheA operon leader peptide PheL [Serratia sp. UGAL515B_01]WON78979.1 pheA operon leader peptide PheL [Serratia sp. UGAL515B_01]
MSHKPFFFAFFFTFP